MLLCKIHPLHWLLYVQYPDKACSHDSVFFAFMIDNCANVRCGVERAI